MSSGLVLPQRHSFHHGRNCLPGRHFRYSYVSLRRKLVPSLHERQVLRLSPPDWSYRRLRRRPLLHNRTEWADTDGNYFDGRRLVSRPPLLWHWRGLGNTKLSRLVGPQYRAVFSRHNSDCAGQLLPHGRSHLGVLQHAWNVVWPLRQRLLLPNRLFLALRCKPNLLS